MLCACAVRKCPVFDGAAEYMAVRFYRRENWTLRCDIREDLGSQKAALSLPPSESPALFENLNPPPELSCARKPTPNEQWRRYGPQEPNYVHIAGAAVLLLV